MNNTLHRLQQSNSIRTLHIGNLSAVDFDVFVCTIIQYLYLLDMQIADRHSKHSLLQAHGTAIEVHYANDFLLNALRMHHAFSETMRK